jgi:hypothetical protein
MGMQKQMAAMIEKAESEGKAWYMPESMSTKTSGPFYRLNGSRARDTQAGNLFGRYVARVLTVVPRVVEVNQESDFVSFGISDEGGNIFASFDTEHEADEALPRVMRGKGYVNDKAEAWRLARLLAKNRDEACQMKPDASRHNPKPSYLRGLIATSGLSQKEAAQRIGIDERAMRRYLASRDAAYWLDAPYPVQYALEQLSK